MNMKEQTVSRRFMTIVVWNGHTCLLCTLVIHEKAVELPRGMKTWKCPKVLSFSYHEDILPSIAFYCIAFYHLLLTFFLSSCCCYFTLPVVIASFSSFRYTGHRECQVDPKQSDTDFFHHTWHWVINIHALVSSMSRLSRQSILLTDNSFLFLYPCNASTRFLYQKVTWVIRWKTFCFKKVKTD